MVLEPFFTALEVIPGHPIAFGPQSVLLSPGHQHPPNLEPFAAAYIFLWLYQLFGSALNNSRHTGQVNVLTLHADYIAA